jgi:hypothetical protein
MKYKRRKECKKEETEERKKGETEVRKKKGSKRDGTKVRKNGRK